jgi:hypothetical protein
VSPDSGVKSEATPALIKSPHLPIPNSDDGDDKSGSMLFKKGSSRAAIFGQFVVKFLI